MQRRLLRSFVGIALVMILGLGVPLGIVAGRLVTGQARERLRREADVVIIALGAARSGVSIPADAVRPFLSGDSQVTVVDRSGEVVLQSGPRALGSNPLGVSEVSSDGLRVTVQADGTPTSDRIRRAWLVIGAVSVAALSVAIAVALALSRRLSRPLRDLAAASERLGAGAFPVEFPSGGIHEIDAVASQLRSSAERLGHQLERERAFANNASHQLRTALTALRLRVDELGHVENEAQFEDEIGHVVRQTDRLEATIEDLLAYTRDPGGDSRSVVRLDEVTRERTVAWTPAFSRAGREFGATVAGEVTASGSDGLVRQVLDILLDNALRHGGGATRVTVETNGSLPIVRVSDEGPGIAVGQESRVFERGVTTGSGSGIGLALARELVESVGGRLVLARARPAQFEALFTPPREEPSREPTRPDS